ncbi:hypothetical protein AC629_41245 [Bradyrhizobium sp. NAS80.1]|uniref:hypothetical protein n=1 Tax=Bradyrhizobium sp. NAS80.1 TaxID=1680159 RepID=UPI000966DFB1|nr:hypothetical protein [Bradyrhizobium sp. NAS80.1]OKO69393.1 hypothetical protein AC629_41245 [Bradyrhizobium sp. NAS80.1]
MAKANRKSTTPRKTRTAPKPALQGLDLIRAPRGRINLDMPDLKRELRLFRHPNDIVSLVALFDAYLAGANALLGIENQPRAEGLGILTRESSFMWAKALVVAEHMKAIQPSDVLAIEHRARALLSATLELGHGLEGARAVLEAAMAAGTAA